MFAGWRNRSDAGTTKPVTKERAKPDLAVADGPQLPAHPPMISVVAPSGTGKTTLLEGVIGELTRRGHQIGAVKHDAHRLELDTEGKDSWRLREAGSASTVLMGRNQFAWFGEDDRGPTLAEIAALFFAECDLILVEGFRSAGLDTVLVSRPDHSDDRWEPPDPAKVLLTVTPDEVERVADNLERRFDLKGAKTQPERREGTA